MDMDDAPEAAALVAECVALERQAWALTADITTALEAAVAALLDGMAPPEREVARRVLPLSRLAAPRDALDLRVAGLLRRSARLRRESAALRGDSAAALEWLAARRG
jgi:hypothetical protein